MNTAIDFHRAEPETEAYVDEVPALGTYVVQDGDIHDARQVRPEQHTICFCTDDRHADNQADPWGMHATRANAEREARANSGHLLARELFAVVRVVKA